MSFRNIRCSRNAVFALASGIVAAAIAFGCAGKPEPERISNLDRQVTTTLRTEPPPEQKKEWQPQTPKIGMKKSEFFDGCIAKLRDGKLIAFVAAVSIISDKSPQWNSNGYKFLEIDSNETFDKADIMAILGISEFYRRYGLPGMQDSCPPPQDTRLLEQFLAYPDSFIGYFSKFPFVPLSPEKKK